MIPSTLPKEIAEPLDDLKHDMQGWNEKICTDPVKNHLRILQ